MGFGDALGFTENQPKAPRTQAATQFRELRPNRLAIISHKCGFGASHSGDSEATGSSASYQPVSYI
jgi:hypothetical protein